MSWLGKSEWTLKSMHVSLELAEDSEHHEWVNPCGLERFLFSTSETPRVSRKRHFPAKPDSLVKLHP